MKNKNKTQGLMGLLDLRNTYHSTQTIGRWRQAINSFENKDNPNRVVMYDMYADLLLDGHLECVWQKRLDAVLNRRLTYTKDGVVDKDITKLLNSPDMRLLISELLNSIAWGYTLIQVNNIKYHDDEECYHIDFDLINRKHVHPEPKFRCVSKDQSTCDPDFLYQEEPMASYMIWAGDSFAPGLFVKAAPYVIYKRGGFGDWAQFSEMFGMPFREAIYDSYDDETRKRVELMMEEWGASNYFVHQRDVEIKIHDSGTNASSSEIFDRLISVCDAGISKVVLGNTLTTEQGSNGARSLGEVHEDEQENKELSDANFILSILNTQFRAVLKKFDINATGGTFEFDSSDTDWQELQTKWNVINSVAQRVPVDDNYIYEEMGIPKPDNYDQMKKKQEERRNAILNKMNEEKKVEGKINKNAEEKSIEEKPKDKKLIARIVDFFGLAPM